MHTQKSAGRGKLLRLGEAAEILEVHPDTVRRWADQGKVPFVRTPGGERRFRREDLALVYGEVDR